IERDRLVKALPAAARVHETYRELLAEIKKRDAVLDQDDTKLRQLGPDSYYFCRELENRAKELPHQVAHEFAECAGDEWRNDHAALMKIVINLDACKRLRRLRKVCKTDADGHFHFRVPPNENFVLFTHGRRETPNAYERYQW